MNSSILPGQTYHMRLSPLKHGFVYPVLMFSLDLSELDTLSEKVKFFGHNRFSLFSVYDADYLVPGNEPLYSKVMNRLSGKPYCEQISRIELITSPRYLNYVFNPASFFYCYNEQGEILSVILEVNNTFGERHTYVFDELSRNDNGTSNNLKFRLGKEFYVSPFNDLDGDYSFTTNIPNGSVEITLDICDNSETLFRSRLWGDTEPLSQTELLKATIKYPFTVLLTLPRIIWQAAKLHYGRKLKVQEKPLPRNKGTLVVWRPGVLVRVYILLFERWLNSLSRGGLEVIYPNGEKRIFGSNKDGSQVPQLLIHDYEFFCRVAFGSDIGFGESYADGLFDCSDLKTVMDYFTINLEPLEKHAPLFPFISRLALALKHYLRKNSISGSKKNISAHYDLSNELFSLLLDSTMTYSSAVFERDADSLETAQENKFRRIIEKAQISASDHVLEIGCGWGGFAEYAAKTTGCKVTGITLSTEQLAFAKARMVEAGLSDNVELKICDYRDVEGEFDKIVSIEMLEAVGYQYFDSYFSVIERRLKKNGIAVLQVITLPDQRYDKAKYGIDWIQKHIFPGSTIPCISVLAESIKRNSTLVIDDLENIASHYAKTLYLWRKNLYANAGKLENLGFDEKFRRAWEYYLTYCEVGFASGILGDLQIVLKRPNMGYGS